MGAKGNVDHSLGAVAAAAAAKVVNPLLSVLRHCAVSVASDWTN